MNSCKQLQKLSQEHDYCLSLAKKLADIAKEGSDTELAKGVEIVKRYNDEELEVHLQHEEQTIFLPLMMHHEEHAQLCITLGKEHGLLRTLVENITLKTAEKDLTEFASVLERHTLMEEKELFPLLESLFTEEQLDKVFSFVPRFVDGVNMHEQAA